MSTSSTNYLQHGSSTMAAASSILFLVIRLVNNCSSDYPTLSQHNLTLMTVVTLDYCNGQLPRGRPYVGTWSIDRRSTMPSYNCSCNEDDPMTGLKLHRLTEFANYNSMCFRRNEGTSILGAKTILPHKGGFFANGTRAFSSCSSRDDEPRTDGGTTPSKLGVHFAASNAPDACGDYRALAAAGTFLEEHGFEDAEDLQVDQVQEYQDSLAFNQGFEDAEDLQVDQAQEYQDSLAFNPGFEDVEDLLIEQAEEYQDSLAFNQGSFILGAKTILPHKGGFFANGTRAFSSCSSRDYEPRTDGGTTPSKLGVYFFAICASPPNCSDCWYDKVNSKVKYLKDDSKVDRQGNDQLPEAPARKLLVGHVNPTKIEPDHLKEVARKERKFGVGARVATAVSALLVLFCTVSGLLRWCMLRKKRRGTESVEDPPILQPDQLFPEMGPIRYTYSELVAATSNFAEEKMLGKGGFGPVYQGYLNDQNRHVAVKMFSSGSSSQGRKEFLAEVKIMSRLRHRNLVQLVGWCDRQGLLLVYELVPGGSLDKHLHDPERILTWAERYRIALGLGSAILYLHTECNQCVVHGDIKPSNVMLDLSGNAKLGDFGLARLVNHGAELQTTAVVAGTVGYIDPEFVNNRKPTTESDVYSFGVVLLEIACGRRPMPPAGQSTEASTTLLKRVRDMYDQNAILEAADGKLNGAFNERQMERVLVTGLWCVTRDQNRRPSIAQAMSILRSEDAELPVLPAAMHGDSGQIRFLEEQAYGDLSVDSDRSTCSSAATAYHTPEDSSYLYREE